MFSPRLAVVGIVLILTSGLFFNSLQRGNSFYFGTAKAQHKTERSPYAFATFLANTTEQTVERPGQVFDDEIYRASSDGYFLGIRVLNYALKHDPATRLRHSSIPFIVLVTEDVTEYKRRRLAAEGMIVVQTNKIALPDGMVPAVSRYRDVMTKLRLWTLTSYRKICFIDADTLIVAPLDGIFEDPNAELRRTDQNIGNTADNEPKPPASYLFAARDEAGSYSHPIPPDPNADYLNSGFFVFRPSIDMLNYYLAVAEFASKQSNNDTNFMHEMVGGAFPEQDLLNYIHRPDGSMPWQHLHWKWNMGWPSELDFEAGVKSFHDKFWEEDPAHAQSLKAIWTEQRWRMEGFMQAVMSRRGSD